MAEAQKILDDGLRDTERSREISRDIERLLYAALKVGVFMANTSTKLLALFENLRQ
jgi:hypothetical protein